MIRRLLLASAAIVFTAGPVLAADQIGTPMKGVDGQPLAPTRARPSRPAPAAVPGSRAEPELAVPADRPAGDMPPTAALFDAVNRGDLNAARDAVGRGADIFGHNVLGLTPLELSVDLGRNDISFLLLSLRGGAGYRTSAAPSGAPPAAPTTAEQRRAERQAEQEARRQQQVAARAAASAAPAAPQSARRFAADGGAPVPSAGFLGFDATR